MDDQWLCSSLLDRAVVIRSHLSWAAIGSVSHGHTLDIVHDSRMVQEDILTEITRLDGQIMLISGLVFKALAGVANAREQCDVLHQLHGANVVVRDGC